MKENELISRCEKVETLVEMTKQSRIPHVVIPDLIGNPEAEGFGLTRANL